MKQALSLLLAPFLLFATANAQNSPGKFSVNVSTSVISTIEVVTLKSMDLTEAEQDNNIIRINPTTSPNSGKMVAIGNTNSEIRITFPDQRELTNQRGSSTLLFNYQVAGNQEDDQSSSELLNSDHREFEMNDQGRFYLWIGGNVDISTAVPGNYQGEFTLDIEYI